MYKITYGESIIETSEKPVYIRLSQNGSYVPCDESVADGICVKVEREMITEIEDGDTNEVKTETTIVLEDTVFKLKEDGLTGAEPLCVVEEINE